MYSIKEYSFNAKIGNVLLFPDKACHFKMDYY